jgi:regulator of protease activity HflC (stomatin/prohibitin superfamily)
VNVKWPKQVDQAFEAFISASQTSGQKITESRTHAETTLNKTAGQVAESLYGALQDTRATPEQLSSLWSQATGEVQDTVAQAQAYQTRVVERARANADYLQRILPEYRKHPELVATGLYLDAMQQILQNVDEKFIIDKCDGVKDREIRISLNRDPLLKPRQTVPAR